MIFTQRLFFVFFLLVLAVYWLLRGNRLRKHWLLVCSYAFYASWDPRFLTLIVGSTAVDFFVGKKIFDSKSKGLGNTDSNLGEAAKQHSKWWLGVSLVVNLGLLGTFKYFDFFISSGVEFANWIGLPANAPAMRLILPVGISFYTFQTLSYTIDIYRGRLQPTPRFLDFAFFVAFFPQLVAGPIVRASEFLPQMNETKRLSRIDFAPLAILFLLGFVKKAFISDHVSIAIDPVFESPQNYDWMSHLFAIVGYSVQIYCDFSGYSDIAIASAGMFGYQLPVNFRFPYFASNIREFWQRWHISLSNWLRDYVYIPLGGSRGTSFVTYRNLMVTMLLGGLWHGASWNFVLWGAVHGVLLAGQRFWDTYTKPSIRQYKTITTALSWLATISVVVLLWIPFRIRDIGAGWQFFTTLCFPEWNSEAELILKSVDFIRVGFIVALFAGGHLLAYWSTNLKASRSFWVERLPRPVFWFGLGIVYALALAFANADARPFEYSQF